MSPGKRIERSGPKSDQIQDARKHVCAMFLFSDGQIHEVQIEYAETVVSGSA
jgi:hypothetical protein